jgi:hypothetical protein
MKSCAGGVRKEKRFQRELLKPLSVLWSHQGLNLGPSDYESDALTN